MAGCLVRSTVGLESAVVWMELAAVVLVLFSTDSVVGGEGCVVMLKPFGMSLTTGASAKFSTVALMSLTVTLRTVMGVYLEQGGERTRQ